MFVLYRPSDKWLTLTGMATLLEDIKKQSEWTVKAFQTEGMKLDYSLESLLEIDRFVQKYSKNGQPIKGGRLSKNLGGIIFSMAAYIGETLIKNVPNSHWVTHDNDPYGELNIMVELGNGNICWPGQKLVKRIQNGLEDGIYPYAIFLTDTKQDSKYDGAFWRIATEVPPIEPKKPWWRF